MLEHLTEAGHPVVAIGKVQDLFAGRGITAAVHTTSDEHGMDEIESAIASTERGLIFANLVDFDMLYGHRRDLAGYTQALIECDAWLADFLPRIDEEDLVIITADHGNDPTTPSTDHAREIVPLLVLGGRVRPVSLGRRQTFADIGQTVAEFLDVRGLDAGTSFLSEVWRD